MKLKPDSRLRLHLVEPDWLEQSDTPSWTFIHVTIVEWPRSVSCGLTVFLTPYTVSPLRQLLGRLLYPFRSTSNYGRLS